MATWRIGAIVNLGYHAIDHGAIALSGLLDRPCRDGVSGKLNVRIFAPSPSPSAISAQGPSALPTKDTSRIRRGTYNLRSQAPQMRLIIHGGN